MRDGDIDGGPEASAGEEPTEEQDRKRNVARATLFVSILVYAIMIGVNFNAKVQAKQVEAFGAEPLGLPVTAVVVSVETLLFLPMPWVFWNAMRLAFQASEDGRVFGIGYLLTVGSLHPHMRRSQIACLAGLLYFGFICGAWIVYASIRGI